MASPEKKEETTFKMTIETFYPDVLTEVYSQASKRPEKERKIIESKAGEIARKALSYLGGLVKKGITISAPHIERAVSKAISESLRLAKAGVVAGVEAAKPYVKAAYEKAKEEVKKAYREWPELKIITASAMIILAGGLVSMFAEEELASSMTNLGAMVMQMAVVLMMFRLISEITEAMGKTLATPKTKATGR